MGTTGASERMATSGGHGTAAGGIAPEDFESLRLFLDESCGIVLGPHKAYLVRSRLGPLLRELGYRGFGELVRDLRTGARRGLRERVIEAMTTNETSWFRDRYPYALLEHELLPAFGRARVPRIRIWSAACSTGQEPYSISITAHELGQREPGLLPPLEIVGTDISPAVLEVARRGVYDEHAVRRGLTPERLRRHFRRVEGGWEVLPHVRAPVRFRPLNLLEGYALLGRFHVIFCRNVLIYFDPERRRDILERMARILEPGGALILGSSEALPAELQPRFRVLRAHGGVCYRLPP